MLIPVGDDGTQGWDDGITNLLDSDLFGSHGSLDTDARFRSESSKAAEAYWSHSEGVASTGRRIVHHLRFHPSADQIDPPVAVLLRMRMVMKITGLGRSTIYRLMASHEFPSPVRLAPRAVAWRRADIDSWSQTRPTVPH